MEMSERLQVQKCINLTTCQLSSNHSRLLNKYRKPLVLQPPLIHAKLAISQPGDKYEQEADRVAEQIMRTYEIDTKEQIEEQIEDSNKLGVTRVERQIMHRGESSLVNKQGEINEAVYSEGCDVLQRWSSDVHENITQITGNKVLSDPYFVWQVAKQSAAMDVSFKRIFWTLPPYLGGISKGEGPEHGEAGNYWYIDESFARSENLKVQNGYLNLAVQYYKEANALLKKGQPAHKVGEIFAKSALALGNACHIAQDRGSHGEGVYHKGHDDPRVKQGWASDDKFKNKPGYDKAIDNTTILFKEWKRLTSTLAKDSLLQRRVESVSTPKLPSFVHEVLHSPGQPLDPSIRAFMEPRFGYDFSRVRVHTDAESAESARAVGARAYTVGWDVVFGTGQYEPETRMGRQLLAHELTHILQQSGHKLYGKDTKRTMYPRFLHGRMPEQVIQRDKSQEESQETKSRNLYFVIGSESLNLGGGEFLSDFEALKERLLKVGLTGEWTMALTVHGAETFFGLTARGVLGELKEGDPGTYNKSKIKSLFGDKRFQRWRDSHGPTRINLLSCQIGKDLETAFLKLILNPSSKQIAVGLGEGCILRNTPIEAKINNKHIKNRKQYDALLKVDKETVFKKLEELNINYGYNGNRVDSKDILNYYFDVAPEGLWVKVEVLTKKLTLIPYLGRQYKTTFINECTPIPLRQHRPTAPP